KNLLSNALKFTEHGMVSVSVALCPVPSGHPVTVAIAVRDSGIGIPQDKQKIIFEAFQQADGSTARKYGGTGLGLSISRELAALLGGEICMESTEGEGTTFTLYLPINLPISLPAVPDQEAGEKHCACPEMLALPSRLPRPAELPEKVSGVALPDSRKNAQQQSEESRKNKRLLVAEQDAEQRKRIITLIGTKDAESEEAASGQEISERLKKERYDCMVMGLDFPDVPILALLQRLRTDKVVLPPLIIYTDRTLSREEDTEIRQYEGAVIIRGPMSETRLLDEVFLVLHRTTAPLPETKQRTKQRTIRNLQEDDALFQGKRILLVDDDMRNIFALAKVLRDRGMETVKAEDGARALEILEQEKFDLVLMGI
ncbi:MAG: response regulator, partial [Candidatus Electrothrix sp. AUS1_2]|nr:response regulator [Candidatus Electrothrix sp. AUS1_2]